MIALAENDDNDRILEFARHQFNEAGCSNVTDELTKHAEFLAPDLGIVDGEVRLLNKDGTPRMTDPSDGTGTPIFYPIQRYIAEELLRDVPEARWKPYP